MIVTIYIGRIGIRGLKLRDLPDGRARVLCRGRLFEGRLAT